MRTTLSRSTILAVVIVGLLLPAAGAAAGSSLPVWGSVPTPNRSEQDNVLLGIDIIDPTDIWAVGEYDAKPLDGTAERTLAMHWNGARWQLVPTPNPSFSGLDFANLEDVSGITSNDVWAVGHGDDFSTLRSRTLIEHWDGTRWRIVPSPNPAGQAGISGTVAHPALQRHPMEHRAEHMRRWPAWHHRGSGYADVVGGWSVRHVLLQRAALDAG